MWYAHKRVTSKIESSINQFPSSYLMINVFDVTPQEKERYIFDMLERGYSYPQIMKECHVSPNTISSVKKKVLGTTNNEELIQPSETSKESQAFQLFQQGKPLIEAKIELDIPSDEIIEYHKRYQELRYADMYNKGYEKVKGNISPYLQMFELMNSLGLTPEQVQEQVKFGVNLPHLQSIHTKMNNQIQDMASKHYYLDSQLQSTEQQVQQCKNLLQNYDNECVQKRNEIKRLSNEIERKKIGVRIVNFKVRNIRAKKAAMANRISDAE